MPPYGRPVAGRVSNELLRALGGAVRTFRLGQGLTQERLAEAAGLVVELVAGGYDLEPLGPHDDRLVILARRPGGAG